MFVKEDLNTILLDENVSEKVNKSLDFILAIIPEFVFMIGFEHNNPHHHLDVYNHTLKALEDSPIDLEIRMALLLHDIGKPFSYQDCKGIRHFNGHPKVSAKISETILKRLNYEETFINNVIYLIRKHDDIINVKKLDNDIELIKKLLEMQYCDAKAHNPDKVKARLDILDKIKENLVKIQNV